MKALLLAAVGFGAGILSAWGVGGGTILLLVMTLCLGWEQTEAQGMNLLFFLPTAAAGLWFHHKHGLIDRQVLKQAIPWGLGTATLGAFLTSSMDVTLLRKALGVLFFVSGISLLRKK